MAKVKNPLDKPAVPFWAIATGVLALIVAVVVMIVLFASRPGAGVEWRFDERVPENLSVEYIEDEDGTYVNFTTESEGADRLDLFSDPRCPACKMLEDEIEDDVFNSLDNGEIDLNVHMMTFLDDMTGSDYSNNVASVFIAIAKEGNADAAWKFYEAMWANQPGESVSANALINHTGLSNVAAAVGASDELVDRIANDGVDVFSLGTESNEANSSILSENVGQITTPTAFYNLDVLPDPFALVDILN